MPSLSENNTIWIAVPYYCKLLTPQQGLSKIFFFAQVDIKARQVCHQIMRIWQGEASGSLASWLRRQGAAGVLSTDPAPYYAKELQSEGLWLWQAPAADSGELLKLWIMDFDGPEGASRFHKTDASASGAQL